MDDFSQVRASFGGHLLCHQAMPVPGTLLQSSRPYLEGHVRARVRALSNVGIIDDCEAIDLATAAGQDRVTGARSSRGGDGGVDETLDADLVVDATGRTARTTAWLPALGFDPPVEERVQVHVKHSTRTLRLRPRALGETKQVIIGAQPGRPRGMGLFAVEHGRWLLTVFGYAGQHPPTDPAGFLAFAEAVGPPEVFTAIRDAEPLDDIVAHRFPASLRRRSSGDGSYTNRDPWQKAQQMGTPGRRHHRGFGPLAVQRYRRTMSWADRAVGLLLLVPGEYDVTWTRLRGAQEER